MNLHYSLTLDLFGSEESTNAANFFHAGVKGRFKEDRLEDDHRLVDATYPVAKLVDGEMTTVEVPALNGLNARLRDDFMEDCLGGIARWNRVLADHGIDFELGLPHVAFNRAIGEFSDIHVSPGGDVLPADVFEKSREEWLPTTDDREFIESLMQPEFEPGKFATWIAPPQRGIDNKPVEYEYVQIP